MALRLKVSITRDAVLIHAQQGFVRIEWVSAPRAPGEPLTAAMTRAISRLRTALRERRHA